MTETPTTRRPLVPRVALVQQPAYMRRQQQGIEIRARREKVQATISQKLSEMKETLGMSKPSSPLGSPDGSSVKTLRAPTLNLTGVDRDGDVPLSVRSVSSLSYLTSPRRGIPDSVTHPSEHQLEILQRRISTLTASNLAREKQVKELKTKLETGQADRAALARKIMDLERDLGVARAELTVRDRASHKGHDSEAKVSKLSQDIVSLKAENLDLRSQIGKLSTEKLEYEKRHKKLESQQLQALTTHERLVKEMEEELNRLRSSSNATIASNASAELFASEKAALEQAVRDAGVEKERAKLEAAALHEQLRVAMREAVQLRDDVLQARTDNSSSVAESSTLREQLSEVEAKLRKAEDELIELRSQKTTAQHAQLQLQQLTAITVDGVDTDDIDAAFDTPRAVHAPSVESPTGGLVVSENVSETEEDLDWGDDDNVAAVPAASQSGKSTVAEDLSVTQEFRDRLLATAGSQDQDLTALSLSHEEFSASSKLVAAELLQTIASSKDTVEEETAPVVAGEVPEEF